MARMDFMDAEGFPDAFNFAKAYAEASNYPMAYAYAAFLTLSGHAIGRSAWVNRRGTLYTNLYTCLIGPSGIAHKSTLMKYACAAFDLDPATEITSPKGFLEGLAKRGGEAVFKLDELAQLLFQTRKDYAETLMQRLTDLYDCPNQATWESSNKPVFVANPTVSILAASTADWIQASTSFSDLMGGFGNRMTWVLGDVRPENPEPEQPPDFHTWPPTREGEVLFTHEAYEMMGNYEQEFNKIREDATPMLHTLTQRIPDKVLKAATVQAVWEDDDITPEILHQAIKWGQYLYRSTELLAPWFEPLDKQVLSVIRQGYNTNQEIYRELGSKVSARQVREVLRSLQEMEVITKEGNYYELGN